MRAQSIYKRAYCFDFDDTLIKTPAKIRIYRNDVFVKSLTPKEYNFYSKQNDDTLDFDEFLDGEMIINAKKYKAWPIIRNISKAIKEGRTTSKIYILTARDKSVKSYIYEFLKKNGIKINLDNVITIGDSKGYVNIAEEKKKVLKLLKKKYDEIVVFDDNLQTINLASSIPGVKTRLIEAFTQDSDPIKDLGIGIESQIKKWLKKEDLEGKVYSYPHSALIYCSGYGKTEWVKYLIEAYPVEMFKSTEVEDNAIPWAAANGNLEIVKMLLDYGLDPTKLDNYALRFAKQNNHKEIVELLLKDKRIIAEEKTLRSRGILEKFIEDSDPIQDMDIGIRKILEDEYKIEGKTTTLEGSKKFFNDYEHKLESFFIYMFLGYLLQNKKLSQKNINGAFKDAEEYFFQDKKLKQHIEDIELVKKALKDHYGIDIEEDFVAEQAMGGVSSPGSTLCNTPGMGNVTPATTTLIGSGDSFGNTIGGKPYTQGGKIIKRRKKAVKKRKKKVNEKFVQDSDPIKDLGIGIQGLWDYTPEEAAKEIWELMRPRILKAIDIARRFHKSYITSLSRITERGCEELAFEPNKPTLHYLEKLVKKEIEKSVLDYPILADYIDFKIIAENMNEAFRQNSDPIHDMGIGIKRKYDEEVEDFIFNLSEKLGSAMEVYLSEKRRIDLFNKVKYQRYKVKTIIWDSDDDKWSYRHGPMSKQWKKKNIEEKYLDKGWKEFWYENNYDQAEFILIKPPIEKLKEQNTNPYNDETKIGKLMKGSKTSPFKKKKSKKNQNAMVQRKFEHEILTFNEFKDTLNEDK